MLQIILVRKFCEPWFLGFLEFGLGDIPDVVWDLKSQEVFHGKAEVRRFR
jgi:hypothetical protein